MTTQSPGMKTKVLQVIILLTIADVTASNENAANATFTVSLGTFNVPVLAVKRDVN